MPIAALPTDLEAIAGGFGGPACQRRREVLRETIAAFRACAFPDQLHRLAAQNLERWRDAALSEGKETEVLVVPGDWGAVTHEVTRRFGKCFAVLNMANAFYPGGAYGEGAPAQEENMFRRTDCHFQVRQEEISDDGRTYTAEASRLLRGVDGRVYLDVDRPRVCIRGPENRTREGLGYEWLPAEDIFPFYELRASAQDLRDGAPFDRADALRRIEAIFDTLIASGIQHVVLGALGCGAFGNPAMEVAGLFRQALVPRRKHFAVVVFAIYRPGYGPDNFTPFAAALGSEL